LPEPPSGPGEVVAIERPSKSWLRYRMLWFWIGASAIGAAIVVALVATAVAQPLVLVLALPVAGIVLFLVAVHWFAIQLEYHTTCYVVTDRAIRLRRGIWLVTEMTFTYANVQNVTVAQGPVERMFGIAHVIVDTAGGGAAAQQNSGLINPHSGRLVGLDEAHRVRNVILEQLRRVTGAGLGDHDDREGDAETAGARRLRLLEEIRDATRRLHAAAARTST